jgi:DNA adenine methylase
MARTTSPLQYYGGKAQLAKWIISHLPQATHYIEPYCGSAAVFFAKERHPIETINDLDGLLVNFYRHLADPKKFPELKEMIEATPYSRAEFNRAKAILDDADEDPLGRAWAYFIANMQSLNGNMSTWGYTRNTVRCGLPKRVRSYWAHVEVLEYAHTRLRTVQLECADALDVIKRYDSEASLFYLDPPYLHRTRVVRDCYAYETDEEHHRRLMETLRGIKGKAVLSGYDHEMYRCLEQNGWERHEKVVPAHAAVRNSSVRTRRTEVLWVKR